MSTANLELRERFKSRLQGLLSARDLTQKGLASGIGVSQAAITKWLAGTLPHSGELFRLAQYFSLRMEWFLEKRIMIAAPTSDDLQKGQLTLSGISEQTALVALSLDELLNRVLAVTDARGKKGELAAFLGVRPSRLSEWLAGNHEPGAGVTLRMLAWVQVAEAKQESSGAVEAAPKPKTRNRKTSREKKSSSYKSPR